MLTAYDELPHPVRKDAHWRESWYLNFFDHAQGLYGIAWMGVRPLDGHGEVLFAVGKGHRFLHKFEDFTMPIPKDIQRERTCFGPLAFTVINPYQRWDVDFTDGAVSVHLEWEAMTDVYNWEWQDSAKSWHYQHPGTVRGRITIGGETFSFDGYGERDRAWGRRDNSYFRAVHWTTSQYPDGATFEAMHLALDDRDDMYGFVHDQGKSSLISSLEMRPTYAYPGGPPVRATITAADRLGRHFHLEQELLNVVPMGQAQNGSESRQFFTFNRYQMNGKVGYGMMDHWWSRIDFLKGHYTGSEPNRGRLFALASLTG